MCVMPVINHTLLYCSAARAHCLNIKRGVNLDLPRIKFGNVNNLELSDPQIPTLEILLINLLVLPQ